MLEDLDIQYVYKLIVVLCYSFFITRWAIPIMIEKSRKYGYTVEDKYKPGKKKVPVMGGLAILLGILVSLALMQILLNQADLGRVFIFYFVVLVYALYGLADDLLKFKHRYDKILALLILSFPIASMVTDTRLNLLFFHWEIGLAYSLIIVPVYIMVVANLINLHAGYNGLTQGTSLLLLITIGIKSFMVHGTDNMIFLMPILGATIAFLPTVFVPAKALPGNIGDFLVGSAVGGLLVVNNQLWFGIVILIPHIINFLMDTYTIALKKIPDVKFGKIRKDGSIEPPPSMKYKSLKFLIVSWFRLTERQAVLWLYLLTAVFCAVGLVLF